MPSGNVKVFKYDTGHRVGMGVVGRSQIVKRPGCLNKKTVVKVLKRTGFSFHPTQSFLQTFTLCHSAVQLSRIRPQKLQN